MTSSLNFTHQADRRSWVESANAPGADFPLQNLPFGAFRVNGHPELRIGVAIGDQILDLSAAATARLVPATLQAACHQPTLNTLMTLGAPAWRELRSCLSELLGEDTCPAGLGRSVVGRCLVPQKDVAMRLPANVGNYTDFYASVHHAANVGALFRTEQPLLPNYKWVPIGYHGRASSLVVSGTPVHRPLGQTKPASAAAPAFGPSASLDYELELAAYMGPGNPLGRPIALAEAEAHIFGVGLLNDWSARDLQAWEYQPLGPFLAKSFATSVSPWVVTLDALAPFRTARFNRPDGDPAPLPYLADAGDEQHGGFDLGLEVHLLTPRMRAAGAAPHRLSRGNFASMYWTLAQLVTHHTSNGCNLQPGDLLGSGTVSGPTPESRGCLLEITRQGRDPIVLPEGENRTYLLDGDEVILRGFAERPGFRRIGLGECRGLVTAAVS